MKYFLTLNILFFGFVLQAQQLYLEGFGSLNRTKYSASTISPDISLANKSDYLGYGGRIGFGADHFQIGGEYRSNLTSPSFKNDTDSYTFDETYYGGFARTKISRYPAMRFGLVLRLGAGIHKTSAILKKNGSRFNQNYDAIFGFNGGFGFSIPSLTIQC